MNTLGNVEPIVKSSFKDLYALLKPRVMWLAVFTAAVGIMIAPQQNSLFLSLIILLCISIGAGAAGALNMWWDKEIDNMMVRTSGRPLPSEKISSDDAFVFGASLSMFSVMFLGLVSNWLAAFLLAFTIFFYVIVYTIWLKRATPQNIVIGGAAGAFPPIIGWAVVTGNIGFESILMFALIFVWTPPHFWSLALFMKNDYDSAKVPMLTVTNGRRSTRNHIFIYSLILAFVALSIGLSSLSGPIYLLVALVLNIQLVVSAFKLWIRSENDSVDDNSYVERKFFKFSLLYLFFHFGAIMVETKTNIAWPGI